MCLRLRSLLLTYLLAPFLPLTHARLPHPKANDVVIAGKYLVSRCSASIHNSKAALLSSLLREIDADLPTLLVEANTGTDSVYGFTSLFTSNDAIEPVTATYQKLSDGAPVVLPGGAGEKNVTFVCLEPDDPVTGRFLSWLTAQQPNGAAFNQFGEENIYLTPAFFALMRSPQPYRCPLWRRGRIALNGDDILGG